MSRILVVLGATGQQGGSVVRTVLADPELSKIYKIRAVTRNTSNPVAQALQSQGVEIIQGDADDASSLAPVMKNAHTIFAITTTTYDPELKFREIRQGKALADAALAAGVSYFIFSSLPHATTITGGKYTGIESFEIKAEIESYIRSLPMKSAFFVPGSFMQNFHKQSMKPHPTSDGAYFIANIVTPQTMIPLIDTAGDTGKYIGAILAEPEKFEGKALCASTELMSMEEIVKVMSKMSGKTVRYKQLPENVFRGFMKSKVAAESHVQMMLYTQDFGYYGLDSEGKVKEMAKQARGKLTTLEEFLTKNPLDLQ